MIQIIYLNGPSSSGKTTITHALQDRLPIPFLRIGIDQMIDMMPQKVNDWSGGKAEEGFSWKKGLDEGSYLLQTGPFAKKIVESYLEVALTLARLGHHLIIDDVAFGKEQVDIWKEKLADYKVLYVGIHAPLSHIEEREKKRGDRMVGSARGSYHLIHKNVTYDLDLDTSKHTIEECVQKILNLTEEKS